MTLSFPSTKQARRIFKSVMKRHGITISTSRTRKDINLSYRLIHSDYFFDFYNNKIFCNNSRIIIFEITCTDHGQFEEAMNEYESMMILSGKYVNPRREWSGDKRTTKKIKILSSID